MPEFNAEQQLSGAATRDDGEGAPDIRTAALLSAIVDSSDDAIISKDLNGTIMSWNKSAERVFGYTAEEAIGRSIMLIIPPERADEEPKILERLKRGERVDHFETVRVRKDGSRLNISLTISPVKDPGGRIVGASKVARDITESMRQAQALQNANAALQRANADLEQFAYSASHDLQEPLRMVASYSELLQRKFGGQLGPQADEFIRYIVQGALRMEGLLRDLRTYTQLSTMDAEPPGEIDANQVLKKTLANLEVPIRDSEAAISNAELPTVRMHEFQLEQIFQNLIGNAIRYRSASPPQIRVAAEQQGEHWLFSVQDNGIGIARAIRSKSLESSNVFTTPPSTRGPVWGSPSASASSSGSADASGWNPSLAGVQRFSLPSPTNSAARSTGRRGHSILLVEDNPADAGLVREALEEHGVEGELVVIPDGEVAIRWIEALDAGADACPDLLILDLNLPRRAGREVLQHVRKSVKCCAAPVVVLSSSDVEQDRSDAMRLGASRYIKKPLRLGEFIQLGAVFQEILERRS